MSDFGPGTVIEERYVLLAPIGEGGMGTVFTAREIGLERVVAIKFLLNSKLDNTNSRARFQREAKILSHVAHPNIVVFYRFGMHLEQVPSMAMEHVEGSSLSSLIYESGRLSVERSLHIAIQICEALEAAHKRGILHRDLKPSNVMLTPSDDSLDRVKLLDFGLARPMTSAEDICQTRRPPLGPQQLTQTGFLVGTVSYMSPEQCKGKELDARSDVYALGCLFHELLTGDPPFLADTPVALVFKHIHEDVAPLPSIGGVRFPEGTESLVLKALSKRPEHRYQSILEMKEDFIRIRDGVGIDITVVHARCKKRAGNKNAVTGVLAISLATLAVVVGYRTRQESVDGVVQKRESHHHRHRSLDGILREATMLLSSTSPNQVAEADKLTDDVIYQLHDKVPPNAALFQAYFVKAQALVAMTTIQASGQPLSEAKEPCMHAIEYAAAPDGGLYRAACLVYQTLGDISLATSDKSSYQRAKGYFEQALETLEKGNQDDWGLIDHVSGYYVNPDIDLTLKERIEWNSYKLAPNQNAIPRLQDILQGCLKRHDEAVGATALQTVGDIARIYDSQHNLEKRDKLILWLERHLEQHGCESEQGELAERCTMVDLCMSFGLRTNAIRVSHSAVECFVSQRTVPNSNWLLTSLHSVRLGSTPDQTKEIDKLEARINEYESRAKLRL